MSDTTTQATFSEEVGFAALAAEFLHLTTEIGWCTVATVDVRGRPRSRILHVTWEIMYGRPIGWVSTSRSPIKTAHLARNPYVSCSYWTARHEAVFVDCRASWVEDVQLKRHVWALVSAEATERGYDAIAIWPQGAEDPAFEVLRFEPWRVQVTLPDLANGRTVGSSRVWRAHGGSRGAGGAEGPYERPT